MAAMNLVVDEYLHLMVRTHPWDKKRFEAELAQLADWLAPQVDGDVLVEHLADEQLERYFAALPETERPLARQAVDSFLRWSYANGWLRHAPPVVGG